MNVLVIGATGNVGRPLVDLLRQRGVQVRAASRKPGAAPFDFDRPETFAPAVEGVDRVFLMMRTGEPRPEHVAARLVPVLVRAGVQRVVNMSGLGVEKNEHAPMRKAELAVERSGLAFTHVRPNFFMQNFCAGPLQAGIRERNEVAVAAGEAAISFVDARDIAAVAAETLCSEVHTNGALAVTGPAAITHRELAVHLSEACGRRITFRNLSDDEARREFAAAGMPPDRVEGRLGFLALARRGALSEVSRDVERVVGRAPFGFGAFARAHAASWVTP